MTFFFPQIDSVVHTGFLFSLIFSVLLLTIVFALSYRASIYEVNTCLNLLCAPQSNLQCDAKGKQYVFLLLQSASLFSPPRRV